MNHKNQYFGSGFPNNPHEENTPEYTSYHKDAFGVLGHQPPPPSYQNPTFPSSTHSGAARKNYLPNDSMML